jgi:hypothetical protein
LATDFEDHDRTRLTIQRGRTEVLRGIIALQRGLR